MRVLCHLGVIMCRGWWLVGQGVGGWFTSVPVVVPVLDASLSQFVYAKQH